MFFLFTYVCFFSALADLVRTRAFVKKFILMRANIQAVSLKIQTLRSQAAMASAMKGQCGADAWLRELTLFAATGTPSMPSQSNDCPHLLAHCFTCVQV